MKTDKTEPHLEWLGVIGSRWAWATVIGTIAFFGSLSYAPTSSPSPTPNPARPPAIQEYTAGTDFIHVIGSAAKAKLPAPYPNQKKPPCEPYLEEDFEGFCWTYLGVKPPCPEGKAWERDGKCYQRALKAARVPSSGDPQLPGGVANPPTP